jgi:hypothetical protein
MRSVTTKHNYQPQIRPSSCAPVSCWRQGQALRVLRNLDTAGRGRAIERAGSEGMPLSYPTKGMATQKHLTVSSCSENVHSRWMLAPFTWILFLWAALA